MYSKCTFQHRSANRHRIQRFHRGLFALKSCDKELQDNKKKKRERLKEFNVTAHCSAPVYIWDGEDTTRFTGAAKDQVKFVKMMIC